MATVSVAIFFHRQELLLYLQTIAISCKLTIAADHAVAGDNKGNGIHIVSHSNRSISLWIANFLCNVSIRPRFPIRNATKNLPDFVLEFRAVGGERDIELSTFPVEEFENLLLVRGEVLRGVLPLFAGFNRMMKA
ncbi:hypothetical protein RN22_19640 [Grimontia sp. AD028]|nr:hypothetical protein RN22_19640 [Grimontia sp. AD028]